MSSLVYTFFMKNKDENLLKELAEKIRKRRIGLGYSQEKLAEKCEFDRTYISLLERAKRNPSYLNLKRLCIGLEIELSVLDEKADNDKR
jgi:transcriptional regulator with XRE-family HTH domain